MSQPKLTNKLCKILNKDYIVMEENGRYHPTHMLIYGLPQRLELTKEVSDRLADELEKKAISHAAGIYEFSQIEKLFISLLGDTW